MPSMITRRALAAGVLSTGTTALAARAAPVLSKLQSPRIVAEDLALPEGPVWLRNGDLLVLEVLAGRITRIRADGRKEVVAETGGGPNGQAIGPDGRLYVCNNGGVVSAPDVTGTPRTRGVSTPGGKGRIERVD